MASEPYFEMRRGTWKLKYRPDPAGKWVSVTLCKHPLPWSRSKPPKKPPQEAIDRARHFTEIEYRAKHGIQAAPARAVGLKGYLETYADAHAIKNVAASNVQLRRAIKQFLQFAERKGLTSIQGVKRSHCRDYLEWRLLKVKPATLRSERGILMGAWSRAVEDGLIASNPWEHANDIGKIAETSITFWSAEEIERIAEACGRGWQGDLVRLMGATGLRISTALSMDWSWVDWPSATIKIPTMPNVKTAYTHVLGKGAFDLLQTMFAKGSGSGLVFPNPLKGRGVIGYPTARAAIDAAIERTGVKKGTPHDLRHSYARNLVNKGTPITVVSRQLGHTTLAMTQKYVSASDEIVRKYISTDID